MAKLAPPRELFRFAPAMWVEILLLPLFGLTLAVFLDRHAPFTSGGFPWLWLIPLLLGLRFGLAAATLSSLVLVAGGAAAHGFGWSGESPPLLQIVGGLIAALSGGQFSSSMREKLRTQFLRRRYAEERLESLARTYFMTRLSHDLLEEAFISQPATLRSALEQVRPLAEHAAGQTLDPANATDLLQLLAEYCLFKTAALHTVEKGRLQVQPLAAIGPPAPLIPDDPLLVYAREHGYTSYYTVDQILDLDTGANYSAVLPLRNAADETLGMLVVRDIPFLAFTEENFARATAIIQYFADESWAAAQSASLLHRYPYCPPRFAHELIKLQHLKAAAGVDSRLVAIHLPHPSDQPALDAQTLYHAIRRSLDIYWLDPAGAQTPSLLALLPLAGLAGVRGYLDRLDAWLREHGYPVGLGTPGFHTRHLAVDDRPPEDLLAAIGFACDGGPMQT